MKHYEARKKFTKLLQGCSFCMWKNFKNMRISRRISHEKGSKYYVQSVNSLAYLWYVMLLFKTKFTNLE